MSETRQETAAEKPAGRRVPARQTSSERSRTGDAGHSYRIGDKIVRIDAASIVAPIQPHGSPDQVHQGVSEPAWWNAGSGTIEMGLGNVTANVTANNVAMQQAAAEIAGTVTSTPVRTGPLNIRPAWEVESFRWPRLARHLLNTHHALFDQIGNQLLGDLQQTRQRVGICSTFPREGKTTISICLARWAANTGKRVLLIDADIERPQMTAMSGLDCAFGWQSVLDSGLPGSEVMIRSAENGMVFMPCRTGRKPRIVEKFIDRLSLITFQMKYEFDVVIIDLGKIEDICAHGTPEMDVVDAVMVTRDPSRTSLGQMMDTRRVLNNLGIARTYVAQNFARNRVA